MERISRRLYAPHLPQLAVAQTFYQSLGFSLTAKWGPFRFLSYDGYHHHLGINLAAGHNAAPVSAGISGLASFSIRRNTMRQARTDPSHILVTPPASQIDPAEA
jgi:catechol-2,3-dioxygenase